MSRYIDADALIMALRLEYPMMPMFKENQKEWEIKTDGYRKAEEVIRNTPSIDIVRCKECKYWKGDGVFTLNALGEEEKLCKWWSKFGTIRTAETDFCSYGERSRR